MKNDVNLVPNQILRFEFPQLPDSLETMATGNKKPPQLTAQLPENYTVTGQFPLLVHLGGGPGGLGDHLDPARQVAGPRDFVCANLPLFKRSLDPTELFGGLILSMEDFDGLSHAYRTMLRTLFDAVPNLTPERSALGGFSNGAHATSILLAGYDDFILEHFRSFYLVEGGLGPICANGLVKPKIMRSRFLFLQGDQPPESPERIAADFFRRGLELTSGMLRIDAKFVIMKGHGHDFPSEYTAMIAPWALGK